MTPTEVAQNLSVGGTVGLISGLVLAIFAIVLGFQTRYIVQGWLYKETKADAKSWQTLAEGQGEKIARLTTLAEAQQATIARLEQKVDRLVVLTEVRPPR